jgi:integrative and conjugative element protein (TIGR02256 family)
MLLENESRTIRLDLLEMQYYQSLLLNPDYENHLSLPDTISYAGTCRSVTSRLSQDNIALSAALCSKALKKYTAQKDAKIIIWNHSDESVTANIISAEEWERFSCNEWTVYIRQKLFAEMRNQRKASLPNETGGVLIGNFDYGRKILCIASQIEPPDDSIASPTSFIRGYLNLEENLKRITKTTSDNLYYVGEWHSHPSRDTHPSPDDMNLFSEIIEYNRNWCKPTCMLIVGANSVNLLISE